ncbi:uncharacterized protein LOC108745254 [Agrilus planipennis]|uniref:Uncharacterized protein LOC108745254 n=1 Tax=Agrilus planipennis TaxID=224129 RepID=A0A1W4XWU5_AGRPL|nr:uncharacterized protein LOC108745254 [Agrilus planipennis]
MSSKFGMENNLLCELNEAAKVKPFCNFDGLDKNVKYRVKQFNRTQTKYGSRILMESDDFQICLPVRMDSALDDQNIEEFNAHVIVSPTYMIYLGKEGWSNTIKFEPEDQTVTYSILNEVNEAARYKPLYNFDNINLNRRYIVKRLSRVDETEFGPALLMESEDFRIFLPKKMLILNDEQLNNANALAKTASLYMVFLGKCGNANLIRFEHEDDNELFWGRYQYIIKTQMAYENKRAN